LGGLGALFWRAKPTKAPRGDGTASALEKEKFHTKKTLFLRACGEIEKKIKISPRRGCCMTISFVSGNLHCTTLACAKLEADAIQAEDLAQTVCCMNRCPGFAALGSCP